MTEHVLYHYSKTRKQRAKLFVRMGVVCWVYVIALLLYEEFGEQSVPESLCLATLIVFPVASVILFLIARWHIRNPATYRAVITPERFLVEYPKSEQWSFSVNVADIKRFENRQTRSHAGKGIPEHGILMKDGSFHHISMNYGNNIRDMYNAVKAVNPDVVFPYKVNTKAQGLGINKDYDT
ncbi:hypothetical protein LL273_13275 [Marinobacter salarius]|uniref:hypothetical protein n=1 Tax=Marinobacter salarius TaxID=1420917 RepID=UPI001D18B122|nr:hypothetical protein [Marinobacter salarius]MCC4284698.1 hypothetical protein [Marinobacter salarius]